MKIRYQISFNYIYLLELNPSEKVIYKILFEWLIERNIELLKDTASKSNMIEKLGIYL